MKLFFVALLGVVLLAVVWRGRDSDLMRQFTRSAAPEPAPFRFDNDDHAAPARADAGARSGLRKCLRGNEVLYTDAACPTGTREQQVSGGALTVVPGQPTVVVPKLPSGASGLPNARDLLAPQTGRNLREEQIERVVGK